MRKKVSSDGITPSKKATTSVKNLRRRTFQSTPGRDSKSSASIKKTPAKPVQSVNPQSENKSSGTVNIVKRGRPKLKVGKGEDTKEEAHVVSSSVLMSGKRGRGRPKRNLNREETKDESHVSSSMFHSNLTLVGSEAQTRNKGGGESNEDLESDVEEMSTFNESHVLRRGAESLLVSGRGGGGFNKRKRSSEEVNKEQSDDDDDDDEIEIPVGSSMKRIRLEPVNYADLEDIPRVGQFICVY